jgi:predicted MPP superfamily phosphohydrolase
MRNNPFLALLIFSTIVLLIDLYSFKGLSRLFKDKARKIYKIFRIAHWSVPVITITSLVFITVFRDSVPAEERMPIVHFFSGFLLLFYIPKVVFVLFKVVEDVLRLAAKLTARKVIKKGTTNEKLNKISRAQFISRVGLVTAGIPFASMIYGIGIGRFDFTVRRESLMFSNLPPSLNGLKILQLSDFHLGSFLPHPEKVERIVNLVNEQNADIIVFTGDFVNNVAAEADNFVSILSSMRARLGMYSVLGNHDYGDYVQWQNPQQKVDNLKKLIDQQNRIGFDVISNDSRRISVGDEHISLVGVENWGLPPFPQYGDLKKALTSTEENEFKILLSHDPTHWDAQVVGKTNIDLTLSGHTHGAQFGIEIPGWRWSPVNIRYKQWGGLYKTGKQHLYVNTGIGFIGFPGRVGMPPEITVLTLSNTV